jgi:hypothetical protein
MADQPLSCFPLEHPVGWAVGDTVAALAVPWTPRVKQAAIPTAVSSAEFSFFIVADPFSFDPEFSTASVAW